MFDVKTRKELASFISRFQVLNLNPRDVQKFNSLILSLIQNNQLSDLPIFTHHKIPLEVIEAEIDRIDVSEIGMLSFHGGELIEKNVIKMDSVRVAIEKGTKLIDVLASQCIQTDWLDYKHKFSNAQNQTLLSQDSWLALLHMELKKKEDVPYVI